MALSLQDDESKGTEKIWQENGFFGDQRAESTILKANFPENNLVYVNYGTVSLVKGGDKAIYLDFIVLARSCLLQMSIGTLILIAMNIRQMKYCSMYQCTTQQQVYMVVLRKN